jgi:hypothetical protein
MVRSSSATRCADVVTAGAIAWFEPPLVAALEKPAIGLTGSSPMYAAIPATPVALLFAANV